MGLDSVEILMEVENVFGIQIPNKIAEKIITVGDFQNVVWELVKGRESNKCTSQSLFYKLRESFSNQFEIPKSSINLETKLNNIIPGDNRRKFWFSIASSNELRFPELVLQKPYSKFLTAIGVSTIGGGLITSLILINFFNTTKWTLLIPLAGIVFTILVSRLFNFKRTEFNPNNFRDFINQVLTLNYTSLSIEVGVNRKEVEMVITQIIADKSGLDLKEVTPEKKICDDLGID